MPLPENFNLDSFDAVDLWKVTEGLISVLPGLHFARVIEPAINERRMNNSANLEAFLAVPEINGARVSFDQSGGLKRSIKEAYDMHYRIRESMGHATIFETVTSDAEPERADRTTQQEIIRLFLPFIKEVSIKQKKPEPPEIDATAGAQVRNGQDIPNFTPSFHTITRRHEWIDREYIVSVADFNSRLASLFGEELTPYKEVIEAAKTWEYGQSIPPSLDWLAPPKE